jgi:hypothetical protein
MGVVPPGPQRQQGHEADHNQAGQQGSEACARNAAAAGLGMIGRGHGPTPPASQGVRQLSTELGKPTDLDVRVARPNKTRQTSKSPMIPHLRALPLAPSRSNPG